jgi:hypothetical protein
MTALLDGAAQILLPTNLLALAAFALLAGQNTKRIPRVLIATFALGLVTGAILIALALRDPPAAITLLVLAAIAGLMVAIGRPLPALATHTVALVAGAALALNAPPQAVTLPGAIAAQLTSGVAALAMTALVALVALKAQNGWQQIGVRIGGSWIAASAILVLALRFAR